MDPRYRFTLVISCLLIVWWLWVVVTTFLIGPRGLNWDRYQNGVMMIGLAVGAGFLTVWLATALAAWQRRRKTGFEADSIDEFGTLFKMAGADGQLQPFSMTLSKFQPALLATPLPKGDLHPLEAELIGFLQGYRHWPYDPARPEVTLYEQALARWQLMGDLPRTTAWHRVAALARDLNLIIATREQRVTPPWWQLWARETTSFVRVNAPNAAMSSVLLSTLPAFRALSATEEGRETQRALLCALRYQNTPQLLPVNAGALAASLVEGLTRAEAQLGLMDVQNLDELTPARRDMLVETLPQTWLALLGALTPQDSLGTSTVLYRASDPSQPQGVAHWVRLDPLLEALGPHLTPDLRTTLSLWDPPAPPVVGHPGWSLLGPILHELGLICGTAGGLEGEAYTFTLGAAQGETQESWGPALLLNPEHESTQTLLSRWQALPQGPAIDLLLPPARLAARAEARAAELDNALQAAF